MLKVGLLSDSHGQVKRTEKAIALLAGNGATVILHLGDLCSEAVIDVLILAKEQHDSIQQIRLVFGNCDFDKASWGRYAQEMGLVVDDPMGVMDVGVVEGTSQMKKLAFTHGDRDHLMRQCIDQHVHYLCHGHTHLVCDRREKQTRIINPGALHRASQFSVATLDTAEDDLQFYLVD